jgi:Chitinase class I
MATSRINREFFFQRVRQDLMGGSLKSSQVNGLTTILDEWESGHANEDDRWLAYMLGTTHHETDRTIQPIHEYGTAARFRKLYDVEGDRPQTAIKYGNTTPGDGVKYCGRGFVQLTWKSNYAAMSNATGVDLVKNPDRAMELPVATKVMFYGMINGTFTGKELSDYFSKTASDWVHARRIINGLDKANLIAGYAQQYYAAISYTT